MKRIFLSLLLFSSIVLATENNHKEYTVEEMLDKMYSSSDKIEDMEKPKDFKFVKKYISDFDNQEQEIFEKIYLYYIDHLKTQKKDFSILTNQLTSSLQKMEDIKNEGKILHIIDENNNNHNILSDLKYYVDFNNEDVYSEEMVNFTKSNVVNLYSIIYEAKYNRILVFEPISKKTSYFSVINLGNVVKFSFKNLKESIMVYMNKKKEK